MSNILSIDSAVVSAYLIGKAPHRQVGEGKVIVSGNLVRLMVIYFPRLAEGRASMESHPRHSFPYVCNTLLIIVLLRPRLCVCITWRETNTV